MTDGISQVEFGEMKADIRSLTNAVNGLNIGVRELRQAIDKQREDAELDAGRLSERVAAIESTYKQYKWFITGAVFASMVFTMGVKEFLDRIVGWLAAP